MDRSDFWKEQSKTFDESADYYDLYRPGYPPELVDCILSETGIDGGAEILEIGAGSGKATGMFTGKGYRIFCIEPGKNLAQAGQRKFAQTGEVEYRICRFEEWKEIPGRFDLAISAQAFHWVPQPVGFAKCAAALKPGGYLGLFWNWCLHSNEPIDDELSEINLFPLYMQRDCEERIRKQIDEISGSGYFEESAVYKFPWKQKYSAEEYIGFIKTGNSYLSLSCEERAGTEAKVRETINKNGGSLERPYLCVLFLAKRRQP